MMFSFSGVVALEVLYHRFSETVRLPISVMIFMMETITMLFIHSETEKPTIFLSLNMTIRFQLSTQ